MAVKTKSPGEAGLPGRKIVETVAKKEWSFDCLRRIKQIRPLVAVA